MEPRGSIIQRGRPPPDMIRRELGKLLLHEDLRLSARNRRFLDFVVAETLGGRADRIKAYAIGVDVFSRGEDFDPGADPIVRIEATRLRAALSAYYAGAGANDPIRIDMPPGSYIPSFNWAAAHADDEASPVSEAVGTLGNAVSILALHRSDPRDRCAVARGDLLIQAVVQLLSGARYDVFLDAPKERRRVDRNDGSHIADRRAHYSLEIAVHTLSEAKRYAWRLTDIATGRVASSFSVDRPEQGAPSAETIDALARSIFDAVCAVRRARG